MSIGRELILDIGEYWETDMAAVTKIVFLGASSASFGMSMFRDLFSTPDLAGSQLTLVGRSAERLGHSQRQGRGD